MHRLGVDRVVDLLELGAGLDEHAATKLGLGEPFRKRVEQRQHLSFRRVAQLFDAAIKPVAEVFIPKAQHREDQILLGAEVFVHRCLRHTGFAHQLVHAGGVKPVPVKYIKGLSDQLVSLVWAHDSSLCVPICT